MAGKTKKDFSTLNTGRVYDAIAEATAEPAAEEQAAQDTGKNRVNYTAEERAEYLRTGKTQGRPGIKSARINLSFYAEQYEYVKIMSSVRGQTMTEFVNHIIEQNMRENEALYAQAKAFRKAF